MLCLAANGVAGPGAHGMARPDATTRQAIRRAVLTVLFAEISRSPSRLCEALTPTAAAKLAQGVLPGKSCVARVSEAFRLTASSGQPARPFGSVSVAEIVQRGARAQAVLVIEVKPRVIVLKPLALRRLAGRWRLATPVILRAVCRQTRCAPGTEQLRFGFAGSFKRLSPSVGVPGFVRREGAEELRLFKRGRLVAAQSGCLSCHRLGRDGNPGPGPPLTHIGSKLTPAEIEGVLRHARGEMPSFRRLPAGRFRALVTFLSLLR